jgi:hypothetical protein
LFCSEKFPVPLRRDFCCKPLESRVIAAARAGQGAKTFKFPVNFPVSRELATGDRFDCDCVRHHAFSF